MDVSVLELILETVIAYIVPVLELMGVFVVVYGTVKSFLKYLWHGMKPDDVKLKLNLAETLALSLEFKMAGEILRTVVARTPQELSILGAVIVLRGILAFLIHWEIKMERQSEVEELKRQHELEQLEKE